MSTESVNNEHSLPHGSREEFLTAAHENMSHYGNTPYEIGNLIVNHVVDKETTLMAYRVRGDYLNGGSNAAAFLVQAENEPEHDVLTAAFNPPVKADHPLAKEAWGRPVDDRIEALRRARGLEGHVQLKAADREHGLIITTRAPGEEIFARKTRVEPTDEHWSQLRRTARGMRRRGIGFDASGGNVHWDPEAGFTVYDTHPAGLNPRRWVRPRTLIRNVKDTVAIQNRSSAQTSTKQ